MCLFYTSHIYSQKISPQLDYVFRLVYIAKVLQNAPSASPRSRWKEPCFPVWDCQRKHILGLLAMLNFRTRLLNRFVFSFNTFYKNEMIYQTTIYCIYYIKYILD